MSLAKMLICDDCARDDGVDRPADGRIKLEYLGVKYEKDLCEGHILGYTDGGRKPKVGRKSKVINHLSIAQ
jgi:hypothetical protein